MDLRLRSGLIVLTDLRDKNYLSAMVTLAPTPLSRRACPISPFRPGRGGLRGHPAGPVDADPRPRTRARGRIWSSAGRGEAALTETGIEVARRGERVLAAARDLVDFARHRGRLLSGRLEARHHSFARALCVAEGSSGLAGALSGFDGRIARDADQGADRGARRRRSRRGDAGAAGSRRTREIETMRLFDDPFLLAVPADDPLPRQRPRQSRARSISSG